MYGLCCLRFAVCCAMVGDVLVRCFVVDVRCMGLLAWLFNRVFDCCLLFDVCCALIVGCCVCVVRCRMLFAVVRCALLWVEVCCWCCLMYAVCCVLVRD